MDLRERLIAAIENYKNKDLYEFVSAEDLTDFLIKEIPELQALKLPIGTRVTIRSDLHENESYGWHCVSGEMLQYCGKETMIMNYKHEDDCAPAYLLDIDNEFWSWSDEMFVKMEV